MSDLTNAGWDATYADSEESGPDECIAREEDARGGNRRCTCGRHDAYHDGRDGDPREFNYEDIPGCRGCDPVDHECKPYGWGIEHFEDPALQVANEDVNARWFGGPYQQLDYWPAKKPLRDAIWARLSRHNAKREAQSERLWERLCDECQTHGEAVKKYTAWAEKATGQKKGR